MRLSNSLKQKMGGRGISPHVGQCKARNDQKTKGEMIDVCIKSKHPLAVQIIMQVICANSRLFRIVTCDTSNGRALDPMTELPILIFDTCSVADWPDALSQHLLSGGRAVVIMPEEVACRIQHCSLFQAGTCCIVSIPDDLKAELPIALAFAAQGASWVSKGLRQQRSMRSSSRSPGKAQGPERLTAKEEQVVILLQQNLMNRQIGAILGTSERTVKFHVSNVMKKLRVGDRIEIQESATPDAFHATAAAKDQSRTKRTA